tara:strand:- start:2 stop:940 length:939 start_codon:yes stop_codon:yes gene_type:complete
MLTSSKNKSIHQKKCASNKPPNVSSSNTINMRDQYNNNHTDNSTTNITNNNNITIQLNVHGKENYDALLDAIQTKYPQAFVNMVHDGDASSLLKLVHFNADFPENQTIRKKVKKDMSAEVHVGDGKWEQRPAHDVIETFRGQTTKRVCDPLLSSSACASSAGASSVGASSVGASSVGASSAGASSSGASSSGPVSAAAAAASPAMLATVSANDARTHRYLEEVLYMQTKQQKDAYGNTDSMLSPFEDINQQTSAEKALLRSVYALRDELKAEFPTLVGKPMFVRNWKKMAMPEIHEFEREWGTVVDSIDWST